MNTYTVSGEVQRFPGEYGWHYVVISKELSADLRPLIKNRWPALPAASFRVNATKWDSSIMPLKDGPLFIALPAKVRTAESIVEGQQITVEFELKT